MSRYQRERGGRKEEVLSREADEGGQGVYVDWKKGRSSFGRKEIVEREETGVRTRATVPVYGDEVEEESVFAVRDES